MTKLREVHDNYVFQQTRLRHLKSRAEIQDNPIYTGYLATLSRSAFPPHRARRRFLTA